MQTILSTLALASLLVVPSVALADTAAAPTTAAATTAVATQPTQNVAMRTQNAPNPPIMKQAADDRQGLSRIQDQAHQLGANN